MIVLDTQVWFWLIGEPGRLSRRAAAVIRRHQESGSYLSIVSVFEAAMLFRLGRLKTKLTFREWLDHAIYDGRVHVEPLLQEMTVTMAGLGNAIREPADCAIVATALFYEVPLVTADSEIIDSGYVETIW